MGEIQNRPFQLSFNASLKVEFQGSRVTSDSGLILVRELDERLGFGELIARHLTDSRGKNAQLKACPLLLAVVGREPSDAAPVRKQAAADSGFAAAGRIGAAARRNQSGRGRELREGCLRNRFEMGQIMAFWFWQRPCRARPVLWLWNECRKRSQQRQLAVYCRRWESKMEIPDTPTASSGRQTSCAMPNLPS